MTTIKIYRTLFLTFVLLVGAIVTNGQEIDAVYKENLEKAKQTEGIEKFEDGRVKVQVNTKMIEQFHKAYAKEDNVSWKAMFTRYDNESLAAFWTAFRDADFDAQKMTEIKKELDVKYAEIDKNLEGIDDEARKLLTSVDVEKEK